MKSFGIIILLLFLSINLPAQPTNLEVFGNLLQEIIDEHFERPEFDQQTVFLLRHNQTTDLGRWLENGLASWALERGIKVYYRSADQGIAAEQNLYFVELFPAAYSVDYLPAQGEGNDLFDRSIKMQLLVRVIDSNNQIVIVDNALKIYKDSIPADKVDSVEKDLFDFTKADRPRSLFQRLYGPVLVSAATAAIIYLFYSFRSN